MRAADLETGAEYAYRKTRRAGEPFQRVELLQYNDDKRQAQIRYTDGDLDGLKEWVRPTALHCTWQNVAALVKVEAKAATLEQSHETAPLPRAVADAANEVFAATGEDLYADERGITDLERDAVERVASRARLIDDDLRAIFAPPAYRDGSHRWQLPSGRLILLARRFAEAEPGLVNIHLNAEVARYRDGGHEPGERYLHQLLIDKGPAYALAREWAGANQIADDLRADNERLRKLLHEATSHMRRLGDERTAAKFDRALAGG